MVSRCMLALLAVAVTYAPAFSQDVPGNYISGLRQFVNGLPGDKYSAITDELVVELDFNFENHFEWVMLAEITITWHDSWGTFIFGNPIQIPLPPNSDVAFSINPDGWPRPVAPPMPYTAETTEVTVSFPPPVTLQYTDGLSCQFLLLGAPPPPPGGSGGEGG